ncbi:MAG: hypothetical protein LLG13_11015 [Bacteroidales bacterium]|nr:hypothetical protein [Bacteroidales bacterium]
MEQTPLFSKQMSIYVDGSALGCATDFSLSAKQDTIEFDYLTTSRAKRVLGDKYSWSASFSGMVMTTSSHVGVGYEDLMDKIIAPSTTDVSIYFLPNVSTNSYYVGNGLLTSVEMSGANGSIVTYSGEVTGDGDLVKVTTA